jgi:hypothetical protein
MGAPELNANNMQHGKRSRRLIPLGALPPGCAHIRKICSILRSQLEAAVVGQFEEVSIVSAATINTAIRFERHAQMAGKWLRENPDIPLDTRLAISRDIAKASAERDRSIRLLGLKPASAETIWEQIKRAQLAASQQARLAVQAVAPQPPLTTVDVPVVSAGDVATGVVGVPQGAD